jgi:peptidoglycan/xylan/chitin deacetylase (PgdA/CDA1 family)
MSAGRPLLCIKIDVDTLEGYLKGVPRLLEILAALQVRATFCVPMGPDRSGRAIRRAFTRPGFVAKMLRTRAVSMYGWRTMLYGTLLPGPMIAAARPELLGQIASAGHELIPHGWDHVSWHDNLSHWSIERTREELRRACRGMEAYTGRPCLAFAAPGWQATANSLKAQQELGLRYASDTRGWCPFFPLVGGEAIGMLQIPTTLPTLDELIGRPDLQGADLMAHVIGLIWQPPRPSWALSLAAGNETRPGAGAVEGTGNVHVFTIHAEVEGRGWAEWFGGLLRRLRAADAGFLTLAEIYEKVASQGRPVVSRVIERELRGRAGCVSCQGGA